MRSLGAMSDTGGSTQADRQDGAASRGDALPSGATVLFLGDSLTESGNWQRRFGDLTIVNAGRSGNTTTDVLDRLDDVVAVAPATILLMIGTNDLGMRATVEQVVRGIENILYRLHRDLPHTRVVVQSILPRERERQEFVHQVNIHVRQFAPSVKAEFLDLWPLFADEDGGLGAEWSTDRLHLNEAGYDVWAEALRPVLEAGAPAGTATA